MICHGINGFLYRFEEVEMLADLVCTVFRMEDFSKLSRNEIETATLRHDKTSIVNTLKAIYLDIASNNE